MSPPLPRSWLRPTGDPIDTPSLIAGFVISTVGFSVFLYGKKQRREPHLVAGVLMMVAPFVVTEALWMSITAVCLLLGLRAAVSLSL